MASRHDRTNSPDFAAAYRAADRTREADIAERSTSASSPGNDAWEIPQELMELCRQLKAAQDRARLLGIFVDDRDLLRCGACELEEDVLINGVLVTRQTGDADAPDTGLRFQQIGPNLFKCSRCGHDVVLEEEPLDQRDETQERDLR